MMKRMLAVASMLLGGTLSAQPANPAQDDLGTRLLSCLTPPAQALPPVAYPDEMLRRRSGGIVRVRLEFFHPDKPPKASILFSSAPEFEQATRDRLAAYRLPCLSAGAAPVVAVQEFEFNERGGPKVVYGSMEPTHAASSCEIEGAGSNAISYPMMARGGRITEGNVLVRATYERPGPPTKVEVLNRIGNIALETAAQEAASRDALACSAATESWPKTKLRYFGFRLEGSEDHVFNDLRLRDFLKHLKDLDTHRVRFDFSTMGCPFTLQLAMNQPYAANSVGEVGETNLNRTAFIAWLRGVTLRTPRETERYLVGATMRVLVPCGALDLTS